MIKILSLGTPIAFQELLVGISFLVLLAIVNSMGVIASAGVGVAEKLCGFIMLVPSSFMQAMSAFVAQNMGARKPDRSNKALFYGIGTSLMAGYVQVAERKSRQSSSSKSVISLQINKEKLIVRRKPFTMRIL